MFETEKDKDLSGHAFNFGDQNVDRFEEKIQSKLEDRLSKNKKSGEAAEASQDIDFIGEAETPSAQNMESLNLFGVALSEVDMLDFGKETEESVKDKNLKRKFVRDLVKEMEKMDTDNSIQDFEQPSRFTVFDPYADTEHGLGKQDKINQEYTALKYEDSMKLRASLILDAYQRELNSIDAESLSFEDRERYDRVHNLLDYLKSIKVVDAPVLLKIYNLHRCNL